MALSERYVGLVMLALAVTIVVSFYLLTNRGVSLHDVDLARVFTTFNEYCTSVDYYGGCDYRLYYPWFLSRVLSGTLIQIGLVLVAILTSFLLAFEIFGSWSLSGLTALLFASVPVIITAVEGSSLYYISMMLTLAFLLLYKGITRGARSIATIVGVVFYVALILHPAHFILPISLSAMLILLAVYGAEITSATRLLYILLSMNTVYLVLVAGQLASYNSFALSSTLLLALSIPVSRLVREAKRASYRELCILAYIVFSVSVLIFEVVVFRLHIQANFNTVELWGLPGLLAIPGAITLFRRKVDLGKRYLALQLLLVAPFTLLVHLVQPFFIATASALASLTLKEIYELTSSTWILPKKLSINKVLPIFLVIMTLLASYFGSTLLTAKLRLEGTPFRDVVDFVKDREAFATIVNSLPSIEANISRAIMGRATGSKVLIITAPENSYWISGVISRSGIPVVAVATQESTEGSKSLVARILTSEEDAAALILREMAKSLGIEDVFVVLFFPFSERPADKTLYLGVPREVQIPNMRYPILVFDAYGDIYHLFRLLDEANRTKGDYLQIIEDPRLKTELYRSQPLFWTIKGSRTLIAQLALKSFEIYGVNVRNYNVGFEPQIQVQHFELVHAESLELGTINTVYYGSYRVYYMISVFKLRGDVSGTT